MSGPRPAAPRPSPVTWMVGILVVAALAYITLNTLRTRPSGSRGLEAGRRLPPFAVPLALSPLRGDANLAARPGEGAAGRRPACEVRGSHILNSCQLAERGPVVLAFLAIRSERCEDQIDVLDRLRARHPGVQFAVRGDRDRLRRLVRRRGWRLPVGYDRDGAVANAYAVAVCPTIAFARRGGRVQQTLLGVQDAAALERAIAAIEGP